MTKKSSKDINTRRFHELSSLLFDEVYSLGDIKNEVLLVDDDNNCVGTKTFGEAVDLLAEAFTKILTTKKMIKECMNEYKHGGVTTQVITNSSRSS